MAWVPSFRYLLPAGPNAIYCFGYIGKEDTRCVSNYVLRIELNTTRVANWKVISEWNPNEFTGEATDGSSVYMVTFSRFDNGLADRLLQLMPDGRWSILHDPNDFGPSGLWVGSPSNWAYGVDGLNEKKIIASVESRISTTAVAEHVARICALDSRRLVAACDSGLVMLFDGDRWIEIIDAPTDANLTRIHVAAPDQIWFGGWKSTVLRWNGKDRWKLWTIPGARSAGSIASYKDSIYVECATDGVYRLEGENFVKVSDIYAGDLLVHGDNLIACSTGRTISIYDGKSWYTETLEFEPRYTAELEAYCQDWEKKYGNIW